MAHESRWGQAPSLLEFVPRSHSQVFDLADQLLEKYGAWCRMPRKR